MPFNRVLVANRGEVAVRVIRALHELDIEAVAVYSKADEGSMHVRMADRAVCIGPPSASESYLRIPSVIAAATTTGCEAVHPGWGFLAENPAFAEACADNDLVFVGPTQRSWPGWATRRRRATRWAPPASRSCRAPGLSPPARSAAPQTGSGTPSW